MAMLKPEKTFFEQLNVAFRLQNQIELKVQPKRLDIFEEIPVGKDDCTPKFPLDFVVPGTECEYRAYTIPKCGSLPYCCVEGDEVQVPTYDIGNCIDVCLKYIEKARWDVVSRMIQALKAGFISKMNADGWHVLLSAAVDRNIIIADTDAERGQFTKRLLNLMMTLIGS